jgi:hypothetical protein
VAHSVILPRRKTIKCGPRRVTRTWTWMEPCLPWGRVVKATSLSDAQPTPGLLPEAPIQSQVTSIRNVGKIINQRPMSRKLLNRTLRLSQRKLRKLGRFSYTNLTTRLHHSKPNSLPSISDLLDILRHWTMCGIGFLGSSHPPPLFILEQLARRSVLKIVVLFIAKYANSA